MCQANSPTCKSWSSSRPKVRLEQVFVGNGSDEVLAHAFAGLLKHDAPLLFPDITYSFYPVYCRLFDIAYETVPLDEAMQVRVADYQRSAGAIIVPNPNAPTGLALSRGEIATLLEEHPDVPVVIDEAYVDFGAETAIPLVASHSNLLVVHTMSKSRALAGLRVGYAIGDRDLIESRPTLDYKTFPGASLRYTPVDTVEAIRMQKAVALLIRPGMHVVALTLLNRAVRCRSHGCQYSATKRTPSRMPSGASAAKTPTSAARGDGGSRPSGVTLFRTDRVTFLSHHSPDCQEDQAVRGGGSPHAARAGVRS